MNFLPVFHPLSCLLDRARYFTLCSSRSSSLLDPGFLHPQFSAPRAVPSLLAPRAIVSKASQEDRSQQRERRVSESARATCHEESGVGKRLPRLEMDSSLSYRRPAGIYSTSAFTLWETPIVTALLTLRRRVPTREREREREREGKLWTRGLRASPWIRNSRSFAVTG